MRTGAAESSVHERNPSSGAAEEPGAGHRWRDIALEAGTVLTEGWYAVEDFGSRRMRWTRPRFAWRSPPKPIASFQLSCGLPPEAKLPGFEGVLWRGGDELGRFSVVPGANRVTLEVPTLTCGGDFVVTLEKGWVPAQVGLGEDVRELGVLVSSLDAVPGHAPRAAPRVPGAKTPEHGDIAEVAPEHSIEFEERFRGSRELILERQRSYVRYFSGQWNVVDLGCGRGEFLELLRETGSDGWGVDSNPVAVASCVRQGLRAVEADAVAYLETVGEATLDGVFSAQLIEHLSRRELLRLLDVSRRKLRPGGLLVLETVNPRCLTVFSESFYVDPGHSRPIPPELLAFDLESAGFQVLEILYRSPVEDADRLPPLPEGSGALHDVLEAWRSRLNNVLFSDRDYAALARRPV
jgi:SAM-dependent methyltransferase